jgi:CDP-diglyceride synthetase
MSILIEALIFLVQYWIINVSLNTFKFIPGVTRLDQPLDGGHLFFDRRRILGQSTTVLGLPIALCAGLFSWIIVNWTWGLPWLGLIFGLTVYFGHAIGSFAKRRLGWSDGRFLPVVDHGDSVLVSGVVLSLLGAISWPSFGLAFIMNLAVQPLLCRIGFALRLRSKPM